MVPRGEPAASAVNSAGDSLVLMRSSSVPHSPERGSWGESPLAVRPGRLKMMCRCRCLTSCLQARCQRQELMLRVPPARHLHYRVVSILFALLMIRASFKVSRLHTW